MLLRGVQKQNSLMTWSVMPGAISESCKTRHTFLLMTGRRN
jgi:GTP cyclohydrolase I